MLAIKLKKSFRFKNATLFHMDTCMIVRHYLKYILNYILILKIKYEFSICIINLTTGSINSK